MALNAVFIVGNSKYIQIYSDNSFLLLVKKNQDLEERDKKIQNLEMDKQYLAKEVERLKPETSQANLREIKFLREENSWLR